MKNMTFFATALLLISTAVQADRLKGDPKAGEAKTVACAGCHGTDGNSVIPNFPRLAGQYENYLVHVLKQYKNGDRSNPMMVPMVANLSDVDLQNIAAYYASQKGDLKTRAAQ